MVPPDCTICEKRILFNSDKEGLLYFKVSDSDKEWYKKSEEEGFVGHPPNVAWFCEKHFLLAEPHVEKTLSEAVSIIKDK